MKNRCFSHGIMRRGILAIAGATLLIAAAAAPAAAEGEFELSKYGLRVGFSLDPDQFTIGAFAGLGEIVPNLSIRPSVDMGFGSDVFTLIGNGDVAYSFSTQRSVAPYAGAGIGLAYYNNDGSDFEVGLNLFAGVEKDLGGYKSGFAEIRFGIDDMPDFKLTVGMGFY